MTSFRHKRSQKAIAGLQLLYFYRSYHITAYQPGDVSEMESTIRERIWNHRMKRVLAQRQPAHRRYVPFESVRTAVVLFTGDEEAEYKQVMEFIRNLLKRQVQVRALVYTKEKLKPAFWQPSLYVDYLTIRDISWDGRPKRLQAQEISDAEVDVFIDLNYRGLRPVKFLAALSKAKMRIGPAGPNHARFYDLMIDTRKMTNLGQYLGQVIHYLSTIKSAE